MNKSIDGEKEQFFLTVEFQLIGMKATENHHLANTVVILFGKDYGWRLKLMGKRVVRNRMSSHKILHYKGENK